MSGIGNGSGVQRRSEAQWRSVLRRFDASQISVDAFCRREGISDASLYRWRKRIGVNPGRATPVREYSAPVFVDAGTLGTRAARGSRLELKLDLGEGWVVQLVRS